MTRAELRAIARTMAEVGLIRGRDIKAIGAELLARLEPLKEAEVLRAFGQADSMFFGYYAMGYRAGARRSGKATIS